MNGRLTSTRFPYLPLHIEVRHERHDAEALLDTGFDGDVVLPPTFITNGHPPDLYLPCRLADGSQMLAPVYRGTVSLGHIGSAPALVIALGDELLVGRGVSNRFRVTLDHGRELSSSHQRGNR